MNKEQSALLSKAMPVTRKFFAIKFRQNPETPVDEKLKETFATLNSIEKYIIDGWVKECFDEIAKEALNHKLPELFNKIAPPEVNVKQALSIVQRALNNGEEKSPQQIKNTQKLLGKIEVLAHQEEDFYQNIAKTLPSDEQELQERMFMAAQKIKKSAQLAEEDRLYTIQSIKHVTRLLEMGELPSAPELEFALKKIVSDDKIYQKQLNIIISMYQHDTNDKLKNICLEFVRS